MIDLHDLKLPGIGNIPHLAGISAYAFFVTLGIAAGLFYLLWAQRQADDSAIGASRTESQAGKGTGERDGVQAGRRPAEQIPPAMIIMAAALIGGTIGTKIPILLSRPSLADLLVGKSVVGGLIGGTAGVLIIKRLLHIRMRMGNVIAPAAALGLAIGRLGCFFNGCCYGIPATWGVDFGDGLLRLPTQLFEAAFQLMAFLVLHRLRSRVHIPGILFKLYVISYFLFRFLIEFIRINPIVCLGLTVYQMLCLAGIAWMGFMIMRQQRQTQAVPSEVVP